MGHPSIPATAAHPGARAVTSWPTSLPAADSLAYVERHHDPTDANLTTRAEAVLVDTTDWIERWRVDVSGGRTIDTDGDRAVIATGSTCADEIGPDLGAGAEGAWVERLQRQLNRLIGAGLAVDGRYGPATERAVEAWQQLRRMPPTGAMEPATWVGLLPDRSCSTELLVIEDGQASSLLLDIGWGVRGPATWSGAPDRGPAIWIGPAPHIAELSGILRVDGIGSVDIGTPEPTTSLRCLRYSANPTPIDRWRRSARAKTAASRAIVGSTASGRGIESPWWVWMITADQRAALDFPPPSVRIASPASSTAGW